MSTSIAKGAPYLLNQEKLARRLAEKYATDRKIEFDKLNEPVIWAKSPEDAKMLFRSFMLDENVKIDFLSDITAYDNKDHEDGPKRFVLVYQQYSTTLHVRVRIKCLLDEHEEALTVTDLFAGANWLEREVFDMFGISFKGHPNMRRILMDERFSGHPLRKEYPIKQREPFNDNIAFHLGANPMEIDTSITEGSEK
jgi:NADH:ubiquinone oxidoreductase subunit C